MNKFRLISLYIAFGVLAKILPHPSCITPLNNFYLHAGSKLTKSMIILVTLLSTCFADIILSYFYNYPIFGLWSLFTYSGFLFVAFLGSKISKKSSCGKLIGLLISASFIFWLWTNFGAWLFIPSYSKNLSGLITCYISALPFLENALLGDLFWALIIFVIVYVIPYLALKLGRLLSNTHEYVHVALRLLSCNLRFANSLPNFRI
jgi:hypothetical protein